MSDNPVRELAAPNFNFVSAFTATPVYIWSRRRNNCEDAEFLSESDTGQVSRYYPGVLWQDLKAKRLEAAAANYTTAS